MPLSKIDSKYIKHESQRLHQGDIYKDIIVIESIEEINSELLVKEKSLQYAIITTQDCDLDQDYRNRKNANNEYKNTDKFLPSILICPAYPVQLFKTGDHLIESGMKMTEFNSKQWSQLKDNNLYRYHYLNDHLFLNVPELVVDFKHYYTIPQKIAYQLIDVKDKYIGTISELFREHLSSRFCQYLSRIGLPDLDNA